MSQRSDLMNNKNAFSWMNSPEILESFSEELETDVIVVGAGQAGTCAARGASEIAGVDVLVIEQQSKDKQFILGNGEIWHINSKWLEKQGFPKIDIDEYVNDWQLRTNNRSNYRLIHTFAEKCGDCFDWFIEPLSEEQKASIYPLLKKPSKHLPEAINYIRAYPGTAKMPVPVQNVALKLNQEEAMKNGAKFMFETRACQLIVEEGKVKGLIAKQDNRYIRILARKGVILAAGDYSKNEQMCRDLLTEAADLIDNKWKILIIAYLLLGNKRFNELENCIGDIKQSVLIRNLKELEVSGIIKRMVYKYVPPKVEYSLTDLGFSLKPIIDSMGIWD